MQIGGIIVTGLSIWALVDKVPGIGELVGNDLLTGAIYVLLVGGIIVAFIAFFGCIGASREVKCMLLTVSDHQQPPLVLFQKNQYLNQFFSN